MKQNYSIKLLLSLSTFVLSTFSVNSYSAAQDSSKVEPLFTKSAKIYSDITVDSMVGYYNDRDLEEIESLDATEVLFDITVPVFKKAQIRLTLPVYTDGTGKFKYSGNIDKETGESVDGKSVDVDGNAGTYEFATISIEYQLKELAADGYNLLTYGGYGHRTTYLDTTYHDNLNHNGDLVKMGLRYDSELAQYNSNIFATLEYRYYYDTDDINPANDESTSFNIINMTGAWMWKQNSALYPVAEVMYSTNLDNYHALSIVPEMIYSVNSAIDVKLGAPIGISSDADKYGVRFGLTARF